MNIGIIGDGQLGRMLALSGYPLGFNFGFLGKENSPSANLGQIFDNIHKLEKFADIITFESENTDISLFKNLTTPIFPPIKALTITQHRGREKLIFKKLAIPCASSFVINTLKELQNVVKKIGSPSILKTTTQGYDGKGQYIIKKYAECTQAWKQIGNKQAILENFIKFEFETSIIVASSKTQIKYYPMTINTHKNGILRLSATGGINKKLQQQARQYADKIIKELDYIGILTIEFFVKDNKLIANEIAPRVHNSGHWSINGAKTSQFENHLRAISNLPLGSTQLIYKNSAMINLIGNEGDLQKILKAKDSYLHLYDKENRNNRKIGHINIATNDDINKIIALF